MMSSVDGRRKKGIYFFCNRWCKSKDGIKLVNCHVKFINRLLDVASTYSTLYHRATSTWREQRKKKDPNIFVGSPNKMFSHHSQLLITITPSYITFAIIERSSHTSLPVHTCLIYPLIKSVFYFYYSSVSLLRQKINKTWSSSQRLQLQPLSSLPYHRLLPRPW